MQSNYANIIILSEDLADIQLLWVCSRTEQ